MTILNAFRTTTTQEMLFVEGKAFSFEDYFTFGAGETKVIAFDPRSFVGDNITINPIIGCATSGPILIDIYQDITSFSTGQAGTTRLYPSNRREGLQSPSSRIYMTTTAQTLTTRFAGDLISATGTAPANSNGSGNIPGLPFELDKTKVKGYAMKNEDGADVNVCVKFTWFEA